MIRAEKFNDALYALHFVLVTVRSVAYKNGENEIANLLDWAEVLPRFFAAADDKTDEFRAYLQGIIEDAPLCSHLLEVFDKSSAPEIW